MPDRPLTVWDCWTPRLLSRGETLAKDYGGSSFPISLKQIAVARNVRNVIFQPLLVDGCLTTIRDGFKIYVRCKKEQADEMRARFDAEQQLGPLPERMRFTVAHEIAHTLFYRINKGRPTHPLRVTHQRRLNALETVCSKVAARILVPADLLLTELKTVDPFEPHVLRELATRAAVSGPMLVNRMKEVGEYVNEIGAWAYVQPQMGVYSLTAVRLHGALRKVFPGAVVGNPFSHVCSVQDFFVNGGREFRVELKVHVKSNLSQRIQRFQLACEDPTSRANHRGMFVTVRRLD